MKPPFPRAQPPVGHLGRWGREPLQLLEEGAALGPVFGLRLWRSAIVGYSPDWNRFVLGNLDLFRSRGSMSGLSPHLAAGLVQTEAPEHRQRRAELNPAFARQPIEALAPRIGEVVRRGLPVGDFDAVSWSSGIVREILCATFFSGAFPQSMLADFLRPLDAPLPVPFLRRPLLFRRMNRALERALPAAPDDCLGVAFRDLPGGVDEIRVALSAGYDTTAHTLAWLLHHVASDPELFAHDRAAVVNEVLRLYPAGWLGSRRAAEDTSFDDIDIPRGTLVLYSPYLTHRDPALWWEPTAFRPERFADPIPAWGFVPFAAGERTCLGSSFARLVLRTVLDAFADGRLSAVGGDPRPKAGITLAPSGPLNLRRAE
ncbi:cytochrome P450 [Jatrophihabitans lederbergiae]|uniref:Cytochrome P450 n=1 Tax=Jatrophihabitans lederbergiae TaxID=3075547 RepID=A0ABU2J9N4_9ACTN|nr:cytochrome P450 [Jatrophihabitans sp. DSM 44399]MDT0261701.1 cytochrome P450 [Jatrophihabitans sp. DSM 44399]